MLDYEKLIQEAYEAKLHSYAPYSNFHVGAALLAKSGKIYKGCNIENAAYTPGTCAERTAIYKAVSEGEKDFLAIAIVGDKHQYLPPCGVCRQVLVEFCDPGQMEVVLAGTSGDYKRLKLEALFPYAFSQADLKVTDL